MSPRAAWRLETLGFTHVYDFIAGKAAWLASGLPTEGTGASAPRAGDIVRTDVSTCRLTDHVGDVRQQTQAAGGDACLVINDEGIVLGRLRGKAWAADPETVVETVMEEGPTTIRPDTPLDDITKRMRDKNVSSIVVTTLHGKLLGVLQRQDAERRLHDMSRG